MWYVFCYDVAHDRRRNSMARLLEDYGNRVQRSVFEVWLEEQHLQCLLPDARKVLDPREDSLRCYPLCEACRRKAVIHGGPRAFEDDLVWIV